MVLIKKIIIDTRDFIIFIFDGIVKLFLKPSSKSQKKNLLFVRTDAIGDFILWLDAAKTLRLYYKDYHITLVCNTVVADLAKSLPYFDKIIPIKPLDFRKKLIYRYQILKHIVSESYEKAIHFPYTRHQYFLSGEAIIRVVYAKEKIGSEGERVKNWRYSLGKRFYTKLLPASNENLMELKRNEEFLKGLGLKNYTAKIYKFPEFIFQPVHYEYDYIIFPGASSIKKQWPIENFAKVAKFIYNKTGWTGLICGGPGEEILAKQLIKLANVPLINIAGRTSLRELVNLVQKANFLISNDTGIVHIAASVGTTAICILGGWHYGRFLPYPKMGKNNLPIVVNYKMDCYHCNEKCIFSVSVNDRPPCIANISIKQVIKLIENQLLINNFTI